MAQDKAQTGEGVVRRRHGDTKRSQSWNPGIRTLPFFIAYPVGPGPHLLVAGPGRESSDYGLLSSDPSASLLPPWPWLLVQCRGWGTGFPFRVSTVSAKLSCATEAVPAPPLHSPVSDAVQLGHLRPPAAARSPHPRAGGVRHLLQGEVGPTSTSFRSSPPRQPQRRPHPHFLSCGAGLPAAPHSNWLAERFLRTRPFGGGHSGPSSRRPVVWPPSLDYEFSMLLATTCGASRDSWAEVRDVGAAGREEAETWN